MSKKARKFILPIPKEKKEVSLSQVFLDDENPRFAGLTKGANESFILEKLAEEKNLNELIASFRENGYYGAEPLLVIPKGTSKDHYIVIEGNRRTAALKILFNQKLLEKFGFAQEGKSIKLEKNIAEQLQNNIPIQVYSSRRDLWSYLGFRHIKGPMPWDPYSKGLYIVSLHKSGIPLPEIVERIGDQNSLVYKIFNGVKVLQQAEKEGYIDTNKIGKFSFSHLYTILGYTNTQRFLGLKIKEGTLLKDNPIKASFRDNLKSLIEFIYGDILGKNKLIIRSQNPDIRRLDSVLGTSKAVAELKENINQVGALENAFISTGEEDDMVPGLISEVLAKLKKVSGNLFIYKKVDADTYSMAEEVSLLIKDIIERLDAIKDKTKKKK